MVDTLSTSAPAPRAARTTPLRRRLFVLTAAAVLPLAVLAALGLVFLRNQQADQTERVGLELAHSVANAVDAELRIIAAILNTLSTTPTLDSGDLEGFGQRAARLLDELPSWSAILLADPGGRILVDTRATAPAAVSALAKDVQMAAESHRPYVSDLLWEERREWVFHVTIPVRRGDVMTAAIVAVVTPETIRQVLARQQLPPDWIISIIDGSNQRVARSRAHEDNLGGRLADSVQEIVDKGGDEGFGISTTLEGERIYTPFSRLPNGWVAVLGLPTALADAAANQAWMTYFGGVLLSLMLGSFGALWIARTITRPMAQLRVAAEAVGGREVPVSPETPIQEVRDVGAALARAAEDLARGEAERDQLLQRERQARQAAEAADQAKDEFMAILSHELRTPLNAVYGWAKMLDNGLLRDDASIERARAAIVRNADVQIRLIDDLLDLSRIAKGKLRLDLAQIDLVPVAQEAVDAVRPAADAKAISLVTSYPQAPATLWADPARLQQVISNLLTNAVKFTPEGGRVSLGIDQTPAFTTITVRDSGEGIEPNVLPYIFERFRQADSTSTRAHGGLGLGLALAKHLVEQHGGSVRAASPGAGAGATFEVTLPSESTAAQEAVPDGETVAVPATLELVRLDGLRLLVVDDDDEGLALARTILTRAGADVRAVSSAAAALEQISAWKPDALVSDIEMPGEDGYVLIGKLRQRPAADGGAIPAIALSAYGRPQDRQRSIDAGFTMHIPKPVDPGELTSIIAGVARRPPDVTG